MSPPLLLFSQRSSKFPVFNHKFVKDMLYTWYASYPYGKHPEVCIRHDKDSIAFCISVVASLKACAKRKDLQQGSRIDANIRDHGLLADNIYVGNTLISMYAKCGALASAQQVLDELPVRDVISWNALITGYAQQGQGEKAVDCFQRMQSEGIFPDTITYASILKACGITQQADMGRQLHDEIVSVGLLEKNVVLGTALVDMYAKCGMLTKAQKVLNELSVRNVVSWSALIAGYVQQGQGEDALSCYRLMQCEGFSADAITYACILKACGITRQADVGKQIHDDIVSQGLLEKNVVLGNALVDMYVKCGLLMKAEKVLDELHIRNVVSWNTLLEGYVQQSQGQKALDCLKWMQSEGLSPDTITYVCALRACSTVQKVDMGEKIHNEVVSQGLLENNVVLGTALLDMYAKCGVLVKAQRVLDELPVRDVVAWNALIAGYAQQGQGQKVLGCFQRMQSEGVSPDAITYAFILKACGATQQADMGKQIHEVVARKGLLGKSIMLGNALVDMYAKCGSLTKAQKVLDELPVQDVVSWNALIAGYAQHGQGMAALGCFQHMQSKGFFPDAITYACILKACGITQQAGLGKKLHDEIASRGLLEKNSTLGNALVDMYGKCGMLTKARQVLDELTLRDVVTWNALIGGYAQHGQSEGALGCFHRMRKEGLSPDVVSWNALIGGYSQEGLPEEALNCFHQMQEEGTHPNAITFVNVLTVCSHAGLVDQGEMYFENMREKYGIRPDKEHYTCMVDLFGRTRHFEKAMKVINMMPSSDYPPLWSALLGACQKWGNVKLGRLAFDHAIQLDGFNAAIYA